MSLLFVLDGVNKCVQPKRLTAALWPLELQKHLSLVTEAGNLGVLMNCCMADCGGLTNAC